MFGFFALWATRRLNKIGMGVHDSYADFEERSTRCMQCVLRQSDFKRVMGDIEE